MRVQTKRSIFVHAVCKPFSNQLHNYTYCTLWGEQLAGIGSKICIILRKTKGSVVDPFHRLPLFSYWSGSQFSNSKSAWEPLQLGRNSNHGSSPIMQYNSPTRLVLILDGHPHAEMWLLLLLLFLNRRNQKTREHRDRITEGTPFILCY